ncbi:hypothetical protein E5676_scaffold68G00650 [Cucumis melo var. makuwa]|uniref:Uncharacterized protein n=1 Tax=Cucumis melo var. makuwa TaxID=1194695 RepID=A0A5A7SGZ8_CUCMM|nr:hypothetical protein E6C27_scaffold417G00040 [Cucumis melo var. makuwa]TYK04763.1 hypothetical protein E5676_scaffold68G00650 [Cucumis melo var. makuwa]
MQRIMVVYYIMEEILMNIGKIINEHIITRGLFLLNPSHTYLIKKLCLKAYPALDNLPQVEVKDGVCSSSTLHRIIAIHKNKAKSKHLKTKQDGRRRDRGRRSTKTQVAKARMRSEE